MAKGEAVTYADFSTMVRERSGMSAPVGSVFAYAGTFRLPVFRDVPDLYDWMTWLMQAAGLSAISFGVEEATGPSRRCKEQA